MPIDINLLREKDKNGNPDAVRKSQKDRFADETLVDQVIDLDEQWRKKNYETESAKMKFNANNKEIATKKKAKEACDDLMELSKTLKADIETKKQEAQDLLKQRDAKLNLIGNVLGPQVPIFQDEENNEVVTTWGELPDLQVDG